MSRSRKSIVISEKKFKELQKEAILKSAVYSARIEGNPFTFEEFKLFVPYFRRKEICTFIKNYPFCSFDFISRRFLAVNPKTLHYDLKKLQEEGFIIKAGKTRGVTYKVKD
ncbi:MAG: hypothetical protein UT24_C0008G0073 [Candidatus Woesebacteria bacterium GW2011_GWB1_39_12]|uniref:HTH deoR-type domain-containing protein n=2 Tax=Candidatus Woeseibacteriota TaxID=1752722 RepID=A0A0G0Q6V9_9BACT|nr:MAG: hypothetical protein UT23_C0012G0026 [Candidatus Woesebacteria bacterium GW2011_GWA1_39_12]KKR00945.1 MAG: hypothetical protein UT24_C0008G0073 [Candidatus Woesebacteria bacterium GW2011_GWB1_39_12]